ncbi:sensor domain-containing diguanylate cyclase [Paenibacillus doosanensis]|uniref:sensor domain-containing diguanylate cyclase n=1 Tax=Paenibacillus doosanensis TaxID=1229154 RepID=UPI00217F9B2B|nr:sensor domain-containing diguanylate cyclase [Paenibacillus doosanensis]MCS7460189.1 sensor domain-containing diguanylate cyclase [Paenibacillus doosanensis]
MADPLKEADALNGNCADLSAVLENITDGIMNLDALGRFTYVNSAAERMLERSRSELLGTFVWTSFPAAVGTAIYDNYLAAMATQIPASFEFFIPTLNRWLDVRVYPGRHNYTAYFRDITADKTKEKSLRESEAMYRMIADNSTDMIARISMDGTYLYVSPACRTLLGYEPEELIGRCLYDLLHPDYSQVPLADLIAETAKCGMNLRESLARKKDGTYIWFETTARTILDNLGLHKELITISRDISARKHIEKQLLETNELLQKISTVDALTGVANRRGFDECLQREWKQGRRIGAPLSLIIVDIDYFKRFNDTYGHAEGDQCLKLVAESLKKAARRPVDFIARYGGEEFVIILPCTDAAGAQTVAEQLGEHVEELQIPHSRSESSPYITISSGTATMIPSQDVDPKELFLRADKALYQAKQDGRNRVRLYQVSE